MKPINFFLSGLLISLSSFSTSSSMESKELYIVREKFFEDILNVDEKNFRKSFQWDTATKKLTFNQDALDWIKTPLTERKKMPDELSSWINEYPRRAAVFAGTVDHNSLGAINQIISNKGVKPLGKARFIVQLQDPNNPTLTDVRSLVALPENKNAGFQVASTFFGMLEGDMENPEELLTNMLKHAAQGEELSIVTAPATIYRKYFCPQGNLLENLNIGTTKRNSRGTLYINQSVALNYKYDQAHEELVSIGLHKGAVVSSGSATNPFKKPESKDKQLQLPIKLNNDGLIDTNATQTVNLLFTAAHSIRGKDNEKLAKDASVAKFCQMLLNASYDATLKALALTDQPKVFLTLMGASAFANPIEWVGNALVKTQTIETIKTHGLDVTLIYRMDYKPHRNGVEDAKFLVRILILADAINGTSLMNPKAESRPLIEELVQEYTAALYKGEKDKASSLATALVEMQKTGKITGLPTREKLVNLDDTVEPKGECSVQ